MLTGDSFFHLAGVRRRAARAEPVRRGSGGLPDRPGRRRVRVPVRDPRQLPGRQRPRPGRVRARCGATPSCSPSCASRRPAARARRARRTTPAAAAAWRRSSSPACRSTARTRSASRATASARWPRGRGRRAPKPSLRPLAPHGRPVPLTVAHAAGPRLRREPAGRVRAPELMRALADLDLARGRRRAPRPARCSPCRSARPSSTARTCRCRPTPTSRVALCRPARRPPRATCWSPGRCRTARAASTPASPARCRSGRTRWSSLAGRAGPLGRARRSRHVLLVSAHGGNARRRPRGRRPAARRVPRRVCCIRAALGRRRARRAHRDLAAAGAATPARVRHGPRGAGDTRADPRAAARAAQRRGARGQRRTACSATRPGPRAEAGRDAARRRWPRDLVAPTSPPGARRAPR